MRGSKLSLPICTLASKIVANRQTSGLDFYQVRPTGCGKPLKPKVHIGVIDLPKTSWWKKSQPQISKFEVSGFRISASTFSLCPKAAMPSYRLPSISMCMSHWINPNQFRCLTLVSSSSALPQHYISTFSHKTSIPQFISFLGSLSRCLPYELYSCQLTGLLPYGRRKGVPGTTTDTYTLYGSAVKCLGFGERRPVNQKWSIK